MRKRKPMGTSGANWLDLDWAGLTIIAVFIGLIASTQTAHKRFGDIVEIVRDTFTGGAQGKAAPAWALVITKNPAQQLQVIATLSPRGLEPLLAKSLQEVQRQLAAHPNAVRLGVVDAELRDAVAFERALRASLPASRIVVIERSRRRETIGPMLLDRL